MEETKAIQYSDYVQKNLDMIPWEQLAAVGIKKDYIMGNETIAKQLAQGEVTNFVKVNMKTDNFTILGDVALQARFFTNKETGESRADLKIFTASASKDLTMYGEALKSQDLRDNLLDTYKDWPIDEKGKKSLKPLIKYSYANAGRPVTLKDKQTKEEIQYLVSFDHRVYTKDQRGEDVAFRGTQRLFLMRCSEVENYLKNVGKTMYGVTFNSEQIKDLAIGKSLHITNFKDKQGNTFEACVQFDVVSRRVRPVETPYWRERRDKIEAEARYHSPQEDAEMEKAREQATKQTESQKTEEKQSKGKAVKRS